MHDGRLAQKLTSWLVALEKRVVARKVRANRGHVRASRVAAENEAFREGNTKCACIFGDLEANENQEET